MARAPGASVVSGNEQTVPTASTTNVSYSTATWQKPSVGWFSGANPDRITIQSDGLYLVTWCVFCQVGNGQGLRRAYCTVNGSLSSPPSEGRCAAGGQMLTLTGAVQLELYTNQYVQIAFWHNDGGDLRIGNANPGCRNRLEVVKLSDLS